MGSESLAARPLVIGHRGAPREAPENTLASFRRAVELGADMLELDVQVSADGALVVIHDEDVSRTTDGKGLIRDLTLEQLENLDAGAWFGAEFAGERVPTLAEVCAFARGRVALNVELKCRPEEFAGRAADLVTCLAENDLLHSTIVSSFDPAVLAEVRSVSSELYLAYLYLVQWFAPGAPDLADLRLAALHPEHHLLAESQVEDAHAHGLAVNAWTVDEPEVALRLAGWGVDGIVTNEPGRLRALFGARPGKVGGQTGGGTLGAC